MSFDPSLSAHLATGVTTTCNAWAIARADGVVLGFTDHDVDLSFDGIDFRAETGLTASALQQGTGVSVDNSEAMGALSDAAISEADIATGRFDGAEVRAWLVNWADVSARQMIFRGTIGEITRAGGAFRAELRGLTERLNQPVGRSYQAPCAAMLGDALCQVDLTDPAFVVTASAASVEEARVFRFAGLTSHEAGWFARGMMHILDGTAAGVTVPVKRDWMEGATRVIELWTPLSVDPGPSPAVRLEAGCDKRLATCRDKFANVLNHQGFPDIPGDDWLMVVPSRSGQSSGGSLR
ncbi:DUF2163 domain-containing protein [Pseudooceanicola sp. CBS1P-1]|nr:MULTISPECIES: DUF2163 domain-containing protein [Pseudooceanicola]MBT9384259.1 DUF2163 domain-containing protein [Pseudooceanicola endophyticus]